MLIYLATFPLLPRKFVQPKLNLVSQKNKYLLNKIVISLIFIVSTTTHSFGQRQNTDSLISLLRTAKADTNKVNLLYRLADSFTDAEPNKGVIYANQGLELSKKIIFKKGQGNCLNALGLAYFQMGKYDTALIHFEHRHEIVKEMHDSLGIAGVYDNIGVICIHRGEIEKALELRKKANRIYASLNERSLLASGYTWIGNIYKEKGEYTIALENYLKALKIYEEENDEKNIGYPLLNISSIYRYLKQYEQAKKYATEAKSIYAKTNYAKGTGVSLYRLALIYFDEKDYDNAIRYAKDAKQIFEEIQDIYFQSLVNLTLGRCYRSMGQNELALKYFNDDLPIATQIGDKELISSVLENIGTIYVDNGDYSEALRYMRKSEKILIEINDRRSLQEMSVNFIELYSRINQPDSVVKYLQLYRQLSDSLFSEQISSSVAEMQAKYETEKKDKEILALNLEDQKKKNNILRLQNANDITNLKLQNSIIENETKTQSLNLSKEEQEKQQARIEIYKLNEEKHIQAIQEEKDKEQRTIVYLIVGFVVVSFIMLLSFLNFRNKEKREQAILNQKATDLSLKVTENHLKALRSQMNPHFIFNCVDSIERLLDAAKIEESKICLLNFSTLTRRVLENSMKRRIPLSEEVETLKIYMELENRRFRNPFTFSILIRPEIDAPTTLIPPLILQPFVENSIKHGFRDPEKPSHITIEVLKEDETLICIVEDNGVGRKQCMNIRPLSGFKKESVGMKLTGERLQLISELKKTNAYFLVDDLEDTFNNPQGTRVKVYLPYELSV